MSPLVVALLAKLAVKAFVGAAITQDEFSPAELVNRYWRAFEDPGTFQVVVVDSMYNLFVVSAPQEIPALNLRHDILEVLQIPRALWVTLRPQFAEKIVSDKQATAEG